MNFSVLISIYFKEKPDFFNRAMLSIYDEQNVKPNEIVLIEDGKLTDELYETISKWRKKLPNVLKVVKLEKNVGLGDALAIGLKECKNELVARMDTDDIALSDRFKKQIKIFKEFPHIDVCSGWISEFENEER